MTQKEAWIEIEARKARERYGYDDWDSRNELTRQDWRNVVAPYYPEPLRVPVDVDGLAKELRDAYWTEDMSWNDIVLTALAFLNIEPCDKPEYDPADVALTPNERNELENLRVECKRLRSVAETAVSSIPYVAQSEDKTRLLFFINGEHLVPKSALDEATAKAERQRQALDANRNAIESRGAEIARLESEVKRLRTQRREWTEQDVEELAEAICNAASRVNGRFLCAEWGETYLSDNFLAGARAALAWFDGKRGEV